MKVAVIGAGAMGRAVLQDLVAARELERILILDAEAERAREVAAALGDPRAQAGSVDATAVDQTAAALRGIDVVVNAAQYTVNVPVMRACVRARCHYADLGGMFHTTRKQLELSGDFERAGLTAVVGIGAGPGITNMVACYAADRLDQVESLRTSFAAVDLTDLRGIDVFAPPYSIRTIMEEFTEDTVQFLGGEYRVLPALAGAEDIEFPEPIGKRRCVHTLHSEPATLPAAFAHKGVREVTWKLGMPEAFDEKARLLASVGVADTEPIEVGGVKLAPIDVLAAVVERTVRRKLGGVTLEPKEAGCARVRAIGKKDGRSVEHVVECMLRTEGAGSSLTAKMTGVPISVAAQMLGAGSADRPGVWGPEQAIDPERFFAELTKRGFETSLTTRTVV